MDIKIEHVMVNVMVNDRTLNKNLMTIQICKSLNERQSLTGKTINKCNSILNFGT